MALSFLLAFSSLCTAPVKGLADEGLRRAGEKPPRVRVEGQSPFERAKEAWAQLVGGPVVPFSEGVARTSGDTLFLNPSLLDSISSIVGKSPGEGAGVGEELALHEWAHHLCLGEGHYCNEAFALAVEACYSSGMVLDNIPLLVRHGLLPPKALLIPFLLPHSSLGPYGKWPLKPKRGLDAIREAKAFLQAFGIEDGRLERMLAFSIMKAESEEEIVDVFLRLISSGGPSGGALNGSRSPAEGIKREGPSSPHGPN